MLKRKVNPFGVLIKISAIVKAPKISGFRALLSVSVIFQEICVIFFKFVEFHVCIGVGIVPFL